MYLNVPIKLIITEFIKTGNYLITIFLPDFLIMKYSNYIGVIAAVALIIFCFVPWVYIGYIKTNITGIGASHTNFGRPGALHIVLAFFSIILFSFNKIWAARINLFVIALNFAWSIRNYVLLTQCEFGECPEKLVGIYAVVLLSFLILLMGFLPKINVKS